MPYSISAPSLKVDESVGTIVFTVIRTRVGSPYVIAGINEANVVSPQGIMGFEANGGVLTASNFVLASGELSPLPTRDCFLPILAVLNFSKTSGKPLSQSLAQRNFSAADGDQLENFPLEDSAALMM